MIRRHLSIILLAGFLSACASSLNREIAQQNRQSIDDALNEAAAVAIPDVESPSDEILDDLVPGSSIAVPGLDQDIELEIAFDVSVSNAPARLFFMSLVKDTSVNMVVHPSVEGVISLDLKNVTVREVMNLTREVYGYEYQQNQTGYIVLPARIQSRIFPVDYLNVSRAGESLMTVSSGQIKDNDNGGSDNNSNSGSTSLKSSSINTISKADFWSELQSTLTSIVGAGEGRSIVVDRHSGLVIVRAMPGELRDVEAYLNNAQDNLQRQVILEAKVIEVDLNDSFQSGIDWAAISSSRDLAVGNAGVVRGTGRVLADEAGAPLLNAAGDAVISSGLDVSNIPYANLFAVGSSSSTFASLITFLSTQGNVHVLSSPRVSTVNNQKAVIKVGSDEFFVTEVSSDSTSTASGTTTTPELTLTPFFSGIALDVTPQISEKGEVILHIHPSISEVDDQLKVITLGGETFELPLALSTVRESDSIVKAQNGQVVVIGGLMKNITSDELGAVPGAADIPFFGEAFKQKRKLNRRSELVILLRPIVVDNNKVWTNYIQKSAERVQQININPVKGE
ncbi:MAG: pilus (MSHA type) biogenesis protein MshL [Gammaproteobacteria bacterium]|nr:pilus (MSHA type) biogenesis protein MshL [Gammaproteobacteria bacterium]MDH3857698.1 pilus (MSHA type) biogenesis protein MshL [Gammaproteobacteria bacterium]